MLAVGIGCCGFPVSRKSYYRRFACVEVQQTFYHPPTKETLTRWRQEAPEQFEFTVKAWQLITHTPHSPTYRRLRMEIPKGKSSHYGNFLPTDEVFQAWNSTRDAAKILGAHIVIFQSPRSFGSSQENRSNVKAFFQTIDRDALLIGWEPRGWDETDVRMLCHDLGLFRVVDPYQERGGYGQIAYWRLHGIGGYRYRYSDENLSELLRGVHADKTHYVMFNNLSMFQDGLRFKEMWERDQSERLQVSGLGCVAQALRKHRF